MDPLPTDQIGYNVDAIPKNREAEELRVKTILFFLKPENWNNDSIKNFLLPNMLRQSQLFNNGKEIDLRNFENLSVSHLYALTKTFHIWKKLRSKSDIKTFSTV